MFQLTSQIPQPGHWRIKSVEFESCLAAKQLLGSEIFRHNILSLRKWRFLVNGTDSKQYQLDMFNFAH